MERLQKRFFWDTPLHVAATGGHLQLCNVILDKLQSQPTEFYGTALLNPFDHEGCTPLHLAAWESQTSVCELHIHCEAIMKSISEKNPSNNLGLTSLHLAARAGHTSVCEAIMKNISEKNPSDNLRDTPLHWAAMEGHTSVWEAIMKNISEKKTV